jgi:exo-1,4-beta-D-glucosaminidase
MNSKRPVVVLCILSQFFLASSLFAQETAETKLALHEGWTLQTSAKVEAKGEVISTPQFSPQGWHEATVPTTVVAALVKDKTFSDPFLAMNLRQFAGVSYPIGGNFSNIPMEPDSPYAVSWWYRKPFTVPASYKDKTGPTSGSTESRSRNLKMSLARGAPMSSTSQKLLSPERKMSWPFRLSLRPITI